MANVRLQDLTLIKTAGLVLGLLWLLMADLATAGDYELVVGKGKQLCEVCLKNIEQMTMYPACERAYSAELGFGTPEWGKLDIRKHQDLYKRASKYAGYGDEFAKNSILDDEDQFPRYLNDEIRAGLEMHLAQVDLDNDGMLDRVLKISSGGCRYARAYGVSLVAANANLSGVNKVLAGQIRQTEGDAGYQIYGVFAHRGQTYFDKWDDVGQGAGRRHRNTLAIYKIESGKTRKLCELKATQRH